MVGVSKAAMARRQQRREEVGRKVKMARDAKDWSQETFGEQLGRVMQGRAYTGRSISRIENGEVSMTFELADAIGALLDIDPKSLFPDSPASIPRPRIAAPPRKRPPSPLPQQRRAVP